MKVKLKQLELFDICKIDGEFFQVTEPEWSIRHNVKVPFDLYQLTGTIGVDVGNVFPVFDEPGTGEEMEAVGDSFTICTEAVKFNNIGFKLLVCHEEGIIHADNPAEWIE